MGKKASAKLEPAFEAADSGDVDALAALLDGKLSLASSRNKDGWTPLHQAAFAGEVECCRLLLAHGAKAAAKCNDGDSPAHYAAAQGKVAVLKLLAESGADLEAVDNDGESVLDVCDGARTRTALRKLIEEAAATAAGGEEDEEGWEEEDEDEEKEAKPEGKAK